MPESGALRKLVQECLVMLRSIDHKLDQILIALRARHD